VVERPSSPSGVPTWEGIVAGSTRKTLSRRFPFGRAVWCPEVPVRAECWVPPSLFDTSRVIDSGRRPGYRVCGGDEMCRLRTEADRPSDKQGGKAAKAVYEKWEMAMKRRA